MERVKWKQYQKEAKRKFQKNGQNWASFVAAYPKFSHFESSIQNSFVIFVLLLIFRTFCAILFSTRGPCYKCFHSMKLERQNENQNRRNWIIIWILNFERNLNVKVSHIAIASVRRLPINCLLASLPPSLFN